MFFRSAFVPTYYGSIAWSYGTKCAKRSIQLQSSSSAGMDLLQALVSERYKKYDNPVALCSPPLGTVTPREATALRQTWKHGAQKLVHPSWSDPSLLQSDYQVELPSWGPCELYSGPLARVDPHLETLLRQTFQAVVDAKAHHGDSETKLSRYDLFHGHVFRTNLLLEEEAALVGILFHCAEYPNSENQADIMTNVPLGHCQRGSDCHPTLHDWRYRNVLWSAWWRPQDDGQPPVRNRTTRQAMWLLDGASSEISDLRVDATPFGPDCPNTVWEGHFGKPIGDIYNVSNTMFCAHLAN